jgi:hypothetical protein
MRWGDLPAFARECRSPARHHNHLGPRPHNLRNFMRRLNRPPFAAREVLDLCIASMQDRALDRRFAQIVDQVEAVEILLPENLVSRENFSSSCNRGSRSPIVRISLLGSVKRSADYSITFDLANNCCWRKLLRRIQPLMARFSPVWHFRLAQVIRQSPLSRIAVHRWTECPSATPQNHQFAFDEFRT